MPLSMSMREKWQVCVLERTMGSRTRAYSPGLGINGGWSSRPEVIADSDQCMYWGSAGMTAFTSASYQRSLLLSFPGVVKTWYCSTTSGKSSSPWSGFSAAGSR
jgi:hypothetical protein